MQTKPIIEISDAVIGYKDRIVRQHVDFTVHRSEHWAITGPNGGGKTTLIKTILGLTPLLGGLLRFYDAAGNVCGKPAMGYLPQISRIDHAFPINVAEVIDSGLPAGMPRTERKERVAHLLQAVSLECKSTAPIGRLSGGQLQRVLLARALASDPEILILDEPMSFLDNTAQTQFSELLEAFRKDEITILMVTHDAIPEDGGFWQRYNLG